jgi:hypothetical protein
MICRHCERQIVEEDGRWVDPEATGDDSVWRETCEGNDTFEAPHEPPSLDFDEIAEEQGWDQDSLLSIMRGFISERGLSEALGERAREIADEENSGSDWSSPVGGN